MRTLILVLVLLFSISAFGDSITLEMENDVLNGFDRYYTHGTRISYFEQTPEWADELMDKFAFFNKPRQKQFGIAIGQSIYTPHDITTPNLLENERPYGGWLYGGFILKSIGTNNINYLETDIGIVGPHSYAEDVQTWFHENTGNKKPMGWDNQLNDELGINIVYKHKWKKDAFKIGDFGGQFCPHVGGSLGNVFTYLNGGGEVRLGYNLPNDFLMPSNVEPTFIHRKKNKTFAFLSTGVDGRVVAQNIFLDGNTFSQSHSVDKENIVGDWKTGASVGIGSLRIEFLHVVRSKEFHVQKADYVEFDSVSASWSF